MIRTLGIAALALSVPAAPLLAQTVSPATYVKKAGASDLYEKTSSRLVLATTKNAKLRGFANDMIRDHTTSTNEVKAAAMKAHLHPMPPKLDAMGARDVAALRRAHGTARDTLYIDQQKKSHQMALELHQNYASNGTAAPLKMAAGKIVPVVQHHIEMLQSM